MSVRWRMIDISHDTASGSADLVIVSGPEFGCCGPQAACIRARAAMRAVDFSAEAGSSLELLAERDEWSRVLLVSLGPRTPATEDEWLSAGGYLVEAMAKHRLAAVRLPGGAMFASSEVFEQLVLGALLHSFQLRNRSAQDKSFRPERLIIADGDAEAAQNAHRRATVINRARAWVEQPSNLLTPPAWIEEIRQAFAECRASMRVLGPDELHRLGAGALFAVGRGSEHGSHLAIVEWRGDASRDSWDAALVGKGLTFDSGGLNLKPGPNIAKMRLDMAAGAGVLAALNLAILRKARANVVALVPIAENSIDALAYRPGDVVTSLSGLTIEVADTDAEGRLALADAITYAVRNYGPRRIVDAATLTTAITSVLHEEFAGLYASDNALAQGLVDAGESVGERLWRMPLPAEQDYLAESEIADICNIGPPGLFGRGTGSPAAGAKFLQRFSQGIPWAHIDMCGTAWSTRRTSRGGKGATGYAARLLDRWIESLEVGAS